MKRQNRRASGKKSKKPRFVAIDAGPAQSAETGTASGSTTGQSSQLVDTRSFNMYTLPSGHLASHRQDHQLAIPLHDILRIPEEVVGDAETGGIFMADILPVDAVETGSFPSQKKRRARPELRAASRLLEWIPLRQEFSDEFLRFSGSESPIDTEDVPCANCRTELGVYRCKQCEDRELYCSTCIVQRHETLALHAIEIWDRTNHRFQRATLRELGLQVQLGHTGCGGVCPHPAKGSRRIVVGSLTGVHEVKVKFCQCFDELGAATPDWVQLFRHGWFPATTKAPTTAFTFDLLGFFQELSFQSKTSLYDFWKTIERVTDNSGTGKIYDRYKQLSHVIRIWRHLVTLKRAGRVHDPAGVEVTQPGELAVECPACPHPGKNLPDQWEASPPHIKWLYTLFLMIDANFRAKCKDRGLDDLELAPGWAYFVASPEYLSFVKTQGTQNERSTCSAEHKAILNANLHRDGYLATGVGAVLCARHALVRKNGAGDLQFGERYCNMDYLVFATLMGLALALVLSYDIACQWHKKLAERVQKLPPRMQMDVENSPVRYAIPKKHFRVHGPNHSQYSFNYLPQVGRTYGEGIEAQWAHMNPISLSAREMSPGLRHEVLNDHWGAWNWQKLTNLGRHILRAITEADTMHALQARKFKDFSSTFQPNVVRDWAVTLENWHADPGNSPDPYEEQRTTTSFKSVRLAIADEEAQELARGTLPAHEVSQSVFLQVGLELEEQQRALRSRDVESGDNVSTRATVQEKRNALKRRIELWQNIQDAHMPVAPQLRNTDPALLNSVALSNTAAAPSTSSHGPPIPLTSATSDSSSPLTSSLPSNSGLDIAAGLPSAVAPVAAPLARANTLQAKAEDIPLWLPSAIPRTFQSSVLPSLRNKERRLRIAQADDALDDIRRIRRVLTGITEFRRLNVTGTGQRAGTRVRSLYTTFQAKLKRSVERYRAARATLLILDSDGDWSARLKPLLDGDIRGPGRDDDDESSEGRYSISWIWLTPVAPGQQPLDASNPEEFALNMRVEWARSKARAERWEEETQLLREEMRRTVAYFEWKAGWWREQADRRPNAVESVRRGLSIYARGQAAMYDALALQCAGLWIPYFKLRKEGLPTWALRYNVPMPDGHARTRYLKLTVLELEDDDGGEAPASGGVDAAFSSDDSDNDQ